MSIGVKTKAATREQVNELLELFYPVHYKIGFAFEDGMRQGQLTRNQAAILWLIHYEGAGRRSMRRKDIERTLRTWFEVSSAGITKALRGMSRSPLGLINIVEDPSSAREKQVILITRGERFLNYMIAEGRDSIRALVSHFTNEEVEGGLRFLRKVTARTKYGRRPPYHLNGKKSKISAVKELERSPA